MRRPRPSQGLARRRHLDQDRGRAERADQGIAAGPPATVGSQPGATWLINAARVTARVVRFVSVGDGGLSNPADDTRTGGATPASNAAAAAAAFDAW